MAGAGGQEVERIAVKVVPDTGGFKKKLKAFLEEVEKQSKVEVELELKGEADFKADVEKATGDETLKVKLDLKLKDAKRKLSQFLNEYRSLDIHADLLTGSAYADIERLKSHGDGETIYLAASLKTADFHRQLETLRAESERDFNIEVSLSLARARVQLAQLLKDRTIHVDVEINDALARTRLGQSFRGRTLKVNADLDLTTARERLRVFLRPRRIKIYADIDRRGFMEMATGLGHIFRMMNGVSQQISRVSQVGQMGFQQMSRSAQGVSRSIRPIYLVALPLLIAGIYLLIGAVAGLVIILGAVIGGLLLMVAPIAAIGAGIAYVLKSSDKQAKKVREQLKGVQKTAKGVLREAIRPMTKAIREEIPYIRSWVKTLKGPLKSAFSSSSRHVGTLSLAVQQFVDNALAGLVNALKNPAMDNAVEGFRSMIAALGSSIGLFFSTLAEGGDDYGKMFEALGSAMIKLMPALARMLNAFASVSPGLIDDLASGLTEIFGILSDPTVLAALSDLASFSFAAVVWGLRAIAAQIIWTVNLWKFLWNSAKWIFSQVVRLVQHEWARITDTWNRATKWISQKSSQMKSAVVNAFNGMVNFIKGLLYGFTGWFGNLWNRITGQSSRGALSTRRAAIGPFNGMASAISGIMNRIVGIVSSAWSRISGIASRIGGLISSIASKAGSIGGILDKIPFFLSAPDINANGGDTNTVFKSAPPPPAAGAVTAFGAPSLFDSFGNLASVDASLRSKAARMDDSADSPEFKSPLPSRVFNFTTYAAPNVPVEKQFVKWLDYADTLYAN